MKNDYHGGLCYRLGRDEKDGGEYAQEPASLVDWAIDEGVGLVLWPSDEPQPIWEFRLGDVISYRLYGTSFAPRFWNEPPDENEKEVLQQGEMMQVGSPNDEMFPPLVRKVVRRLMRDRLGVREPKVLLAKRHGQASRLVFNLAPSELGGDEAVARAFAAVAWCIPSCIPVYRIDALVGSDAMGPF